MPVVRLDLEIDSDVYPELHTALAAIKNPALREERLRQLAATGLVWEVVRVQGPPVMQLASLPARPQAVQAAASLDVAGERTAPASKSGVRSGAKSPARKTAVRPDANSARTAESNAGPAVPSESGLERNPPHLATQLPVLVDIVATSPAEAPQRTLPDVDDAAPSHTDSPPLISEITRGSGSRTRLMRMKDRGLFRNG